MPSMLDAMFLIPAAIMTIAVLIPGLILTDNTSEEFRRVTSLGMADTVAQNTMAAFLNSEKNNGLKNYKAASYVMSGNGTALNRKVFQYAPDMFGYFNVYFDSPYNHQRFNDAYPDSDYADDDIYDKFGSAGNAVEKVSEDIDPKNWLCFNVPKIESPKKGPVIDGSCDFGLTPRGGQNNDRETRRFGTKIPVRGGKIGRIVVKYEVK